MKVCRATLMNDEFSLNGWVDAEPQNCCTPLASSSRPMWFARGLISLVPSNV